MEQSSKAEKSREAIRQYTRVGQGIEETIKTYDEHGAAYDEYVNSLNFKGPSRTAASAGKMLGDRFDAKILDVGAGTGLVAAELAKLGYKNIDAVDASEGLLETAKSKGLYTNVFHQFVGLGQLMPVEKDTYDAVVMCGAFLENHMPKEAFDDIIRVVKPGGYIVNVFREMAFTSPWYEGKLEPYMKQLETDGLWKEISRTSFPQFIDDVEGFELIHKVL